MVNLPYDSAWPDIFNRLKATLLPALPPVIAIEHVGSTAVPGLSGKPRIDLDIVITAWKELPALEQALERLGYFNQGDLGRPGRIAFGRQDDTVPRTEPPQTWMKHNLYACTEDSPVLREHLHFRDYLRGHPDSVREYAELKTRLATEFPYDQDAYVKGKTQFVQKILSLRQA